MVVSMALFGLEDMFLKWAAQSLPVGEVVFISGVFGVVIFAAMAWREGRPVLSRAALHPAVLARGLGEMVGTFAYITALATVPLSTVSAVLQALPLAVTMAAALFMQEKVGWRRWRISSGLLVHFFLRAAVPTSPCRSRSRPCTWLISSAPAPSVPVR